jgi:Tfp pilus assembly protein PilN
VSDRVESSTQSSPQLEEPEDRPPLSRGTIILWLIAIGMIIMLLPLSLVASTIGSDAQRINADLVSIQNSLTSVPTPIPEVRELMNSLAQVQEQAIQVQALLPTLTGPRTDWPAIMSAVGSYNPDQIVVSSLALANNQLTISGQAVNDTLVVDYARALEQSGRFSRVVVQSIRVIATPVLTPTVGATITPTATFAPTTDPRDEFEPDDAQPKPIFLSQPQVHSFFPSGDVDQVTFLAKAGRIYRVYTTGLAPGVDTLLTASVGAATYTNDDAAPGVLSSEIVFQMTTTADMNAVAKVTNRGQFGADQRYTLIVEEAIPTPTLAPPPPPSPTNTSAPPNTPTFTPSPTIDQRDPYEPDDVTPKQIALGETQSHTFFPDLDVDKVSFLVKSGRFYQAFTSELALGVDTTIRVAFGSQQWINDDTTPGSGSYDSTVCFQASTDGTASVTITNIQNQFGAGKTYKVSVTEIPDLSDTKCGRTTPAPQTVKVPGLAALSAKADRAWGALPPRSIRADRDAQQGALTVEFVIVADIEVATP